MLPLRFQAPSGKFSGPTRKPFRFLAAEAPAVGSAESRGRLVATIVYLYYGGERDWWLVRTGCDIDVTPMRKHEAMEQRVATGDGGAARKI